MQWRRRRQLENSTVGQSRTCSWSILNRGGCFCRSSLFSQTQGSTTSDDTREAVARIDEHEVHHSGRKHNMTWRYRSIMPGNQKLDSPQHELTFVLRSTVPPTLAVSRESVRQSLTRISRRFLSRPYRFSPTNQTCILLAFCVTVDGTITLPASRSSLEMNTLCSS